MWRVSTLLDAVTGMKHLIIFSISIINLNSNYIPYIVSKYSDGDHITYGVKEKDDVAVVLTQLFIKFGIKQFILWGRSMGAVVALRFLEEYLHHMGPKVDGVLPAIILDSPYSSVRDIIKEQASKKGLGCDCVYGCIQSHVQSTYNFNLSDADSLITCNNLPKDLHTVPPCMVISAINDVVTPVSMIESIFDDLPMFRVMMGVPGTHTSKRPKESRQIIVEFLKLAKTRMAALVEQAAEVKVTENLIKEAEESGDVGEMLAENRNKASQLEMLNGLDTVTFDEHFAVTLEEVADRLSREQVSSIRPEVKEENEIKLKYLTICTGYRQAHDQIERTWTREEVLDDHKVTGSVDLWKPLLLHTIIPKKLKLEEEDLTQDDFYSNFGVISQHSLEIEKEMYKWDKQRNASTRSETDEEGGSIYRMGRKPKRDGLQSGKHIQKLVTAVSQCYSTTGPYSPQQLILQVGEEEESDSSSKQQREPLKLTGHHRGSILRHSIHLSDSDHSDNENRDRTPIEEDDDDSGANGKGNYVVQPTLISSGGEEEVEDEDENENSDSDEDKGVTGWTPKVRTSEVRVPIVEIDFGNYHPTSMHRDMTADSDEDEGKITKIDLKFSEPENYITKEGVENNLVGFEEEMDMKARVDANETDNSHSQQQVDSNIQSVK